MKKIESIKDMVKISQNCRLKGKKIGFVPTMGYFHKGHISLMKKAKQENDVCVVSIFVNPIQFCEGEDFEKYPRDLERDIKISKSVGVDYLFCPQEKEMYSKNFLTFVEVTHLSNLLCGRVRKGHFKGVTTVVAKLINIIMPDKIYFGQKDAQQSIIINKMLTDLNFNVKMRVLPTVREDDGLAMSSRNTYLTPQQRQVAPVLYYSLKCASDMIKAGEKRASVIKARMREIINEKKEFRIEYISICDYSNLEELDKIEQGQKVLIALAAYIDNVRLIDNVILEG